MANGHRPVVRSMQGKEVDIQTIMNQQSNAMAVGNVRVNANGDELGPGGKIIAKQSDDLISTQQQNQKNR